MVISSELEHARSRALEKIGRNVVNFQRMEAMLRFLATHTNVSGHLDKLEQIQKQNIQAMRKRPMGVLAESFVQSVYEKTGAVPANVEVETGISVSFSFSVVLDKDDLKERRAALGAVVAARNDLIHNWLANLDMSSAESCNQLSRKLDSQQEEIRREYEALRSVVMLFRESLAELGNYLASSEFEADFEEAANEA